jgi:23S rRNA-/tRNA-specific pseudouridylate synthase
LQEKKIKQKTQHEFQLLFARGHLRLSDVERERTASQTGGATADASKNSADGVHLVPDLALHGRQLIHVTVPPPPGLFDPRSLSLDLLLDDGVLLCVNKPPGLPVQPTGEHHLYNVQAVLHARLRSPDLEVDVVPHLAHRIDKFTSGVRYFVSP